MKYLKIMQKKYSLIKINNYEEDISNNYLNISDENIGLIPRIIYYLFKNSTNSYTFSISYLEIYNDILSDLLNPETKKIKIQEINGEIIVDGLRKFLINSPEEGIKYINQGTK